MISRSEFIDKMKKLEHHEEITQDDLTTAYKLFHAVGEEARAKMIPAATREIMGKAMAQVREHAYKRFAEGKSAQLPCGGTLTHKR